MPKTVDLVHLVRILDAIHASLSISRGVPDNARLRRYGVLDESHSGKSTVADRRVL